MHLQLILLSAVTVFIWLWSLIPELSYYSLQLVAGLIIILFIKNLLIKNRQISNIFNLVTLNAIILLLIFSTGGISSPFFFLAYFLLFGIAFVSEPVLSIGFSLILAVILSIQASSTRDILPIASIIFVSPLALFFGQQYLNNLAARKRINVFQKKWLETEKTVEKQEVDIILWLSLNLRSALAEAGEIIANLLADLSRLSPSQKTALKSVRRKLRKLSKEGRILARKIDKETD